MNNFIKLIPQQITPNQLTLIRFVLIFPIVYAISFKYWVAAILIYAIAISTDGLDGMLARSRNKTTSFGAKFDAATDKLLHVIIFILFFHFSPILIGTIIFLDAFIIIAGLVVLFLSRKQSDLPIKTANTYGKLKIMAQTIAIFFLFLQNIFQSTINFQLFTNFTLWMAIFFSVFSIYSYIKILVINKI